ncbi:acyl carrier protein [Gemmatimonadota bacterium]
MKDIETTLISYLHDYYLPQSVEFKIDVNENLFDAGILDSAAVLSVIAYLETEFDLTIPDEDLLPEHFACVASTAEYIRKRLDGTGTVNVHGAEDYRGNEEMPDLGP